MPARALARLLTGPLAFLVAGVIDALLYNLISVRRRLAGSARRRHATSTIRRR